MGFYRWFLIFSLMLFSFTSHSESDDSLPAGVHKSFGTHLAYTDRTLDYLGYFTVINGASYRFKGGEGSYTNGYTAKGAYLTGDWMVIDDEGQAWAWGTGEIYTYAKKHPQVFTTCQPIKGDFVYRFGDIHWILDDPSHPDTSGQSQALTYDNCSYKVASNYCPENLTSDSLCTATQMILLSNKDSDDDSHGNDDSSDNAGDSSVDSGSPDNNVSDGSSSGSSSGGSHGSGGSPVFPSSGSNSGSSSGSNSGSSSGSDSGSSSGSDSGSSGGSDSGSSGGSDSGSSGGSDSGSSSGSDSGSSSGSGSGSGGGHGGFVGSGSGSSNDGNSSTDDDSGGLSFPSIDIPELSLSPLWNIWPAARDFKITLPDAKCPVFNITVFGKGFQIDTFCTVLTPDVISLIRLICILTASISSFIIVLRS